MQHTNLERRHSHQFDQGNPLAQKILIATILTAVMMILEILGGWILIRWHYWLMVGI
jgi:Co/Zn/Cd efflux system component